MKRQWRILQIPPEYDMEIRALIPLALCALHNFIQDEDFNAEIPEIFHTDDINGAAAANLVQGSNAHGELADRPPSTAEKRRADACHNEIAAAMWADYVAENA
jgi:hypothetical protein